MSSLVRRCGHLSFKAIALTVGVWIIAGSTVSAYDDGLAGPGQKAKKGGLGLFGRRPSNCGPLGYGAPGLYPGFPGFGLGFHPGYGYGGDGLGVGPGGGYPFYGGPGYLHPSPTLRRLNGITPFPYFGGPGYPSPEHPQFFGGVGPLVPDEQVIRFASEGAYPDTTGGYGCFSGVLPYPDSFFAPFTSPGSAGESYGRVTTPAPSSNPTTTAPEAGSRLPTAPIPPTSSLSSKGPLLGLEEEPVVEADGVRGLKVSKVQPHTAAEKAGLHAGDVIHSINGYLTTRRGDLAWIIADASNTKVLTMSVRSATDGEIRTIKAYLP